VPHKKNKKMNEDQHIKQLPKDWKWVKLDEACGIIMGQSPPSSSYNTDGIGLPFFQGKAEFTELHPVVEKWCDAPNKIAEQNDILLSVRAPVGTTNIANQKCCIGRGLAAIRYENYKYAFYFLRSKQQELDSKGTGTTFRAISGETIRETLFPLPPLPTQLAIVSKIEELFSELEKGIENLRTAQQQLKTYRQSVLKWAFEGKLTNSLNYETFDADDENDLSMAAEPAVSYNLNNNKGSEKGKLPEGWKWVKLETIATKITDGEHITPRRTSDGVLLLSARNIQNGYLELKNVDYIPEDEYERIIKRCNPEFGDILISCSGSVGRVCRVPQNLKFTMVRSVALVKLNSRKQSSKYFEYLFQSPLLQKQIENGKKATAQANLFLGPIKNLDVIECSLEEQNKTVQEIESRLSVADKMEESISQSLQQAEALRQSILKRAFEGKLA
jgi:type I restriction enzyme, S subunit